MPISEDDIESDEYVEGISCPNCFGTHSEEKKKRFAERQKQINLAKERGDKHIGKIYSNQSKPLK
jgi:Predicted sulfurtransferase